MIATSHFIILVSLLAATFAWFQDSKMTIRQRQVQSQFTEKCISLRIPWEEPQICVRSTLHFNYQVAILGTLVGNQQTFLSGMHLAFVIAGGVLVLGLVAALVFTSEHDRRHPKVDSVGKPRRTTRPAETALGRREKSG